MSAAEIAILARAPQAGRAKTRLIPRLGADGAARLQRRLIAQALTRAAASGCPRTLWLDGAADAALADAAAHAGATIAPQPPGDLGARMLAAAVHARQSGRSAIVIGTDCPAQTADDLVRAQALLDAHDVVLQPAEDGGYVLIATRQPQPRLFDDVAWGSADVLRSTRARIAALGLSLAELRTLPDLDVPDDLDRALAAGWIAPCA
jgi:rSAM/selenodomain-associated transferase 1